MKRFLPDSIAGRTLLILLAGLMISHLVATAIYFSEGHAALSLLDDRRIAERIAIITRLVERARPDERRLVLKAVNSPSIRVTISRRGAISGDDADASRSRVMEEVLRFHLGDRRAGTVRVSYVGGGGDRSAAGRPVAMPGTGMGRDMERMARGPYTPLMRQHMRRMMGLADRSGIIKASVRLADSSWLNFSAPLLLPRPFSSLRFVLSLSIMLLAIVGLSIWAVRLSVGPLTGFAQAAERLGVDVNAPHLSENGPREVRRAAHAFNEMQHRIRRFVEDRTQMVAAIAHDLGTPITRLRLRAEYVEDEKQQRKMLADLDEMERMMAATLSFARDDAATEPRQTFDLVSLLHSVCDGVIDAGHDVEFRAHGRLPYDCRPVALSRAFANLVENAVKFGARARVSVVGEPGFIRVLVDDDGPGIPDSFREEVFKPFRRLEQSRSRETGGTGLGLTVARTVIRAHGGDITLETRSEGGLRVEVVLPRSA